MNEFEAVMRVRLTWVRGSSRFAALYLRDRRIAFCEMQSCGRWQGWDDDGKTSGALFDTLPDCQQALESIMGIVRTFKPLTQ